jgi:single-stranded-DNA-specific exonuclease
MKFRWSLAPPRPAGAAELARALHLSPLLAQCLINRGFDAPDSMNGFLQPRLKNLADPFLLPDMRAAVDRLILARERGEKIAIFGDYDVDGVTSTALLIEVLNALGMRVEPYLPNRMDEGYGLTRKAAEACLQKIAPQLLLAVDCGSTAVVVIEWLNAQGVEVIVLDHHQVSSPAPAAVALVNPQRSSEGAMHFRELCSAGLSFKLAHALVKHGREAGWSEALEIDLRQWLDLVALGTIADIVPVCGENRIFIKAGLDHLNSSTRPGILALREVANCPERIGSYEVGFQLGPRLNAAGRLDSAEEALRLLLSATLEEAAPLASSLDTRNRERQRIERGIADQVIAAVRARFNPENDYVIVEGQLLWHIGVVGIVASRVLQEFYRPAIIVGGDAREWRGSGRSIEGFDLAAALRACDDLLIRHGGHAMAAGLTIAPEKLDLLRTRLNGIAREQLTPEQLRPPLRIDAEVTLDDLTVEQVAALAALQPHGPGNPPVQLLLRSVAHQRPPLRMGKNNQHVKFRVTDGKQILDAVWWNCGDAPLPKITYALAFTPQLNEYNGETKVQLKVLDWGPRME